MNVKTVHVLLVEDNDVDIDAVRRGFARNRIANPLHVARDGIEALSMLRGTDGYPAIPRPYLVLLDLAMPRMNGLEFLAVLRKDERLKDSVVFVLTTSQCDRDKLAVYDFNVAGYIVKTDVGGEFLRLTDLLGAYWRVVTMPPEREVGA